MLAPLWYCNSGVSVKFGDISGVERLAVLAAQRWQQLAEIQQEQVHL